MAAGSTVSLPASNYDCVGPILHRFFRLYGDGSGERIVALNDFALFRSVFGKPSTDGGTAAAFDFNGDGQINLLDVAQFRSRFGKVLEF